MPPWFKSAIHIISAADGIVVQVGMLRRALLK